MKTIQYFTDDYLKQCQSMSLQQKLEFLENFRMLQEKNIPSKLISIKIPENLLMAFKSKSLAHGQRYQTQIKKLMSEWLNT